MIEPDPSNTGLADIIVGTFTADHVGGAGLQWCDQTAFGLIALARMHRIEGQVIFNRCTNECLGICAQKFG